MYAETVKPPTHALPRHSSPTKDVHSEDNIEGGNINFLFGSSG
jgi:hypothetical protein